ncbi:hypothetical protein H0H92_005330 [Tricholoma furcatifolium]|nr:hypothetical protein H0H92_005330 [Tricholoma furcatifolium]
MHAEDAENSQESSVERFLDLEAGEDREEEMEGEDREEDELGTYLQYLSSNVLLTLRSLDKFLDDMDDEIETGEWAESARSLSLAFADAGSDDEAWSALLSRARERSQAESAFRASQTSSSCKHPLVQVVHDTLASISPDVSFWRVPVRLGREEAATFILYSKFLTGGTNYDGILSITGCRSYPGSICIESPNLSDVQKLCQDVTTVHAHRIQQIPPQDARLCLKLPLLNIPKPHSWARITKSRLYKGDLAYVYAYDPRKGADALVVPRVKVDRRRTRTANSRPSQTLLKLEDIYRIVGTEAVQVDGDEFTFRSQRYHRGYHRFFTHNLAPHLPTMADVQPFIDCPLVCPDAVRELSTTLERLRLQEGDPVVITKGELKGRVGLITSLDQDAAVAILILVEFENVTVPCAHLRKYLNIGDYVEVVDGSEKGTIGWVTAVTDGQLTLWNHHTFKEIQMAPGCVAFHFDHHVLKVPEPDIPSTRLPSSRQQDPIHHLQGREVTVIGATHSKGYHGYIKNTLSDGSVVVEVEAGVRDVVVDLKNVSDRRRPALMPLSTTEAFSQVPLSKSVPLPSNMAPSWQFKSREDPSSRTPMQNLDETGSAWDPSSGTPLHASEDPSSGTPLHAPDSRLNPKLTFPLERSSDTGSPVTLLWKVGDIPRPGILRVRVGDTFEEVDEQSVTPVQPTDKGQRVIVTKAEDPFYCKEFCVVDCGPKSCRLRPWVRKKTKEFYWRETELLAVATE